VDITLKIDENNLISVTAALNEYPDVQVSKNLSRGKADEKLFLFLEETINEANRKNYTEYIMLDLTYRSLSAIKDINKVVAEETGEVDEKVYEKAELKTEKARKMADEGHSARSTIYYARAALDDFGPAIPPKNKAAIRKSMKRLDELDEFGTYEENVEAIEDLNDTLNQKLGVVNVLMEIQKAGDFCMESNPSKAPKFYQSIEDILKAYKKDDPDRAETLIQEIMPEAYRVVKNYEARSAKIYKDITR